MKYLLYLLVFYTSSLVLFSQNQQHKLSIADGNKILDALLDDKQPISIILVKLDSLNENHFISDQDYSEFLIQSEKKLREKDESKLGDFTFKMSEFFQRKSMHQNAFIYLNRTLRLVQVYPNSSHDFSFSELYEDIGLSYFYFKRWEISKQWFYKSLKEKNISPTSEINVYNTIGMIHRNQNQEDSCKVYFEKALFLANKYKNKEWIGIISGNLGLYYFKKNDFVRARILSQKDLEISLEASQLSSAILAQCILADIDIRENKLVDAKNGMDKAANLLELHPSLDGKYAFQRLKTRYLEKTLDFEGAYRSYQLSIAYKDSISAKLNLENFSNIEFQLDFEKKQAEISVLQAKKKQNELIILALFLLIVTVSTSFFLIFNQYRKRRRREKEILNIDKIRIEQELKNTELQMRKVLKDLGNKNQLVENLNEEIDQIKLNDTDSKLQQETAKISEKLQSFVLLTEENWLDFKKLFEKLNPGFFDYFADNYPDLTNAEVRLAALIKLNLSNLEMAHTLGISPNSVRKTNLRLRKRLNIEEQADLLKLIKEIV